MDIKPIIKHQYHAALTMLKMAIEQCPESAWNDPEYKNAFWHIVYHTLFLHTSLSASIGGRIQTVVKTPGGVSIHGRASLAAPPAA